MFIPHDNKMNGQAEIVDFMQRFSFATIITSKNNIPTATHLPFLVRVENEKVILTSHFARANEQWQDVEDNPVLVIFSEPHAYISPKHYEKELNVPTWNYLAVHAYGTGKLITETENVMAILNATVRHYELDYQQQWQRLPQDYKFKMSKGIAAFEVEVHDLQAKKKISQNKTETEKQRIIDSLSESEDSNERLIAEYMLKDK